jgi:hypothetical protein
VIYHEYVRVEGFGDLQAVVLRVTTDGHAEVKFSRGLVTFVPVSHVHPL